MLRVHHTCVHMLRELARDPDDATMSRRLSSRKFRRARSTVEWSARRTDTALRSASGGVSILSEEHLRQTYEVSDTMGMLIVVYDLTRPGQNFDAVDRVLSERFHARRFCNTTWLVDRAKGSPSTIVAALAGAKAIDTDDKLLIFRITYPMASTDALGSDMHTFIGMNIDHEPVPDS